MDNAVVVLNANGNTLMSIAFSLCPPQQATGSGDSDGAAAAAAAGAGKSTPPGSSSAFKKTMVRAKNEPLQKTLDRLRLNYAQHVASQTSTAPAGQKPSKKTKQKVDPAAVVATVPPMTLVAEDGTVCDPTAPNSEAWKSVKLLRFGDFEVPIHYNLPTVTAMKAPPTMVVDMPAVCSGVSVMFAEQNELLYEWSVLPASGSDKPLEVVSRHSVFTPTKAMVGKKIQVRCRPNVAGSLWLEAETPAVLATLPVAPMERWAVAAVQKQKSREIDPTAFRVVSYNILHDAFCTSKYAKSFLYPFCPEEFLDLNYRKGRVVQELRAYDGDIFCLQEVGRDVFRSYYAPVFADLGYGTEYTTKTGNVNEGSATLWKKSRFEKISHEWLPLSAKTIHTRPEHEALHKEISENHPHLDEALGKVTSVGTITVLRDLAVPNSVVIVTNAHLFWHPNGCHIRAIQLYLLMHRLDAVRQQVAKDLPANTTISTVLCGDYNCSRLGGKDYGYTPTGGYELLSTGKCSQGNYCWTKGLKFWWDMDTADDGHEGEAAAAMEAGSEEDASSPAAATSGESSPASTKRPPPTEFFSTELVLPNQEGGYLDTHKDTPMQWTNYSLRFKEIIDHIFVSKELSVISTTPLPTEEEISRDTAIPSAVFPSDHVAIITDLKMTGV